MTSTTDNIVRPAVEEAIAAMMAAVGAVGMLDHGVHVTPADALRLRAALHRLVSARDYLAAPTFTRSEPGPGIVSVPAPQPLPTPETFRALAEAMDSPDLTPGIQVWGHTPGYLLRRIADALEAAK